MEPKRITSSGFVIELKDGSYLLGKATGHKEPHSWTIFKGGTEGEETLIDTAIRELKEESGIDVTNDDRLNKHISSAPIFSYGMSQKDVVVFLLVDVEGVLDNTTFVCNSFFHVGDKDFPEICEYGKFKLEELDKVIFPSQMGLVEELKRRKQRK